MRIVIFKNHNKNNRLELMTEKSWVIFRNSIYGKEYKRVESKELTLERKREITLQHLEDILIKEGATYDVVEANWTITYQEDIDNEIIKG